MNTKHSTHEPHISLQEYAGNEIRITKDMKLLGGMNAPSRSDSYIILYCRCGRGSIFMDGGVHVIKEDEVCLLLPQMTIALVDKSDDFDCWMLCLDNDYVSSILTCGKFIDNVFGYIHDNPVCNLGRTADGFGRISLYMSEILDVLGISSEYYRDDAIRHSVSAFFCTIMIHAKMAENCRAYERDNVRSSYALVFRRFIQELNKDNGIHRSVKHYADILCYTPKYLSFCVSSVSGKTAHEWIDGQTMERIKQSLRFSTLSIKEISDQLNFPSQSFFCRFVRKKLGMSPMAYRRSFD